VASVDHPIGVNSEQHRAFTEKVFWQTVGVVNMVHVRGKTGTGQPVSVEEMGTGSTSQWKGRKLVLTAKHVLDGAGPSRVVFLYQTKRAGRLGYARWSTSVREACFVANRRNRRLATRGSRCSYLGKGRR
jgi:hypothetical protein